MAVRSITVTAPDARRVTIKIAPDEYMVDVLERVCNRLSLPSNKYMFRSNKSQVDLAASFSNLHLTPGMGLTLVLRSVTPSAVMVALQLPPEEVASLAGKFPDASGRLTHSFRSDTTLWKVLRQFEDVVVPGAVNLTSRGVAQLTAGSSGSGSGQVFWETPVLTLLRREVSTVAEFAKTLAQLGYNSGRVLVKVHFRKTDKPLALAMEEVQAVLGEEVVGEVGSSEAKGNEIKEESEAKADNEVKEESETKEVAEAGEPMEVERGENVRPMGVSDGPPLTEKSTQEQPINTDPSPQKPSEPAPTIERLAVYSPTPSTALHAAQIKDPDSAFTPSIALAQLHQAQLLAATHNKRLLSDDEIAAQEAQKAARLDRIASVDIKVRFPDNWAVDWRCSPAATGADVYAAIREVSALGGDHLFQLMLPDRTALRDVDKETLIKGYKLSGRVLINFWWADGVPEDVRRQARQAFLKDDLRVQAQTVVVPATPPEIEAEKEDEARAVTPKPPQEGRKEDSSEKKVPKWMRLSKK